ncbi:ATP-binding protein [Dactylosporangium sp. CS-047395]|uniref:ATP-binding protein n=1 Tax=Dactylosporangium sp. CS-047395 TaxID=3239936 RepID=UPI003D8E8459
MTTLSVSPPPPATSELRRWVITNVRELQALREALLDTLMQRRLIVTPALDDRADRVLLVASELATNALIHGLPPSVVRLLEADDCFVLDIADHDMQALPELRDVEPFDSGGRGLHLARQLSLDVGWYATTEAKHIWASFPAVTATPNG